MLNNALQEVVNWLHVNPHWAGVITFIISLGESLAVVGTIVPGSVTMTAIGILVGSGVIPVVSTFTFAILGAIAGDSASYFLGFYFNEKIKFMWPFSRHPHLLESGRTFFNEHGGKSVFIGRFLGPLRAVVPVVAGMMRMPNGRFLIANSTSAVLWSFIYILPGVFIGMASTELDKDSSTEFLLIILGALVLAWAVIYLFMRAINIISKFINRHTTELWHWFKEHPTLKHYASLIINPEAPNSGLQLLFLILSSTCFVLFIVIAILTYFGYFTNLNNLILEAVTSLHTTKFAGLLTFISFLGDKVFLLLLVPLLVVYLIYSKDKLRLSLHLISIYITTALSVYLIKLMAHSPRPDVLEVVKTTSSFPSGHATLAVTVIGFITIIIAQPFSRAIRQSIVLPMIALITLVIVSRIYLSFHWFSDILAALMLGLSILFAHILSFYTKETKDPLKPKDLLSVACISLFCFAVFAGLNYKHHYNSTKLRLQSGQGNHQPALFKQKLWAKITKKE